MLRCKTLSRAIPITTLAAALLLTGCGDDDGQQPTPDSAVSVDRGAGADTSGGDDIGAGEGATAVSLSTQVVPIVQAQCGHCHTRNNSPAPKAVENQAYFETKADLLQRIGTAIVAGDAAQSPLIKIMRQELAVGDGPTLMPPPASNRPKMPDSEVAIVAAWIDQGAKDN